jgi:hypothetical protein
MTPRSDDQDGTRRPGLLSIGRTEPITDTKHRRTEPPPTNTKRQRFLALPICRCRSRLRPAIPSASAIVSADGANYRYQASADRAAPYKYQAPTVSRIADPPL